MFPVNDLNLFVYGLATIATTVGYAYTRKLTAKPYVNVADTRPQTKAHLIPIACDPHDPFDFLESSTFQATKTVDTKTELESSTFSEDVVLPSAGGTIITPIRSLSLKRKRTIDDQEDSTSNVGYPHNLASIYPPKKRSRTPSSDGLESNSERPATPTSTEEGDITVITPAPTKVDKEAAPPPDTHDTLPITPTSTHVFGSSAAISSPLPKTLQPVQRPVTSSAFSAFAGNTSPFAKVTSSSQSKNSSWTTAGHGVDKNPNEIEDSTVSDAEDSSESPKSIRHAIMAASTSTSKPTVERITGEENEDVELELKGVKLFVMRGDKPFTDGMVGHLKLLSDKTTLDERLLFRREPLWQAAMNIRMHPSIRCTFDAQESVLRLILKEVAEKSDVSPQERELVIYALKPGRSCSKQDFKEFAESLMKSRGLELKDS